MISGLYKEKLNVSSVMVGFYYGVNVDFASFLCAEFGNSISHSKMTTKFTSVRFWSLILKEVYSQEGISIPSNGDVPQFAPITIPKSNIDDPTISPMVGRVPDSTLNLVSHKKNNLLVSYKASMDLTPTRIIPKAVTIDATEGSSKATKGTRKKKQAIKPKEIEEKVIKQIVPTKSRKGILNKTKKIVPENNMRNNQINMLRKLLRIFLLLLVKILHKKVNLPIK